MTEHVAELSLKAYVHGSAADRAAFSSAFMAGLGRHGFVILKDHGVDVALLRRAYALAEQVFALPDEVKRRYLPSLIACERIASYCLTESGAGSDAAALKARAVRDGDDYVVSGSKAFISPAILSVCSPRSFW